MLVGCLKDVWKMKIDIDSPKILIVSYSWNLENSIPRPQNKCCLEVPSVIETEKNQWQSNTD